jgi:hypothetical protein
VGAALLAALAGAGYYSVRRPPHGPFLQMPNLNETFLGEGQLGEVCYGKIPIFNAGDQPLVFRIEASCACAQLEPREGTIAPGEYEDIKIGVRLRYQRHTESVRLRVYTNDPGMSFAEHSFHARCPSPLTVHPLSVDFGQVQQGVTKVARITVRDSKGAPLSPATVLEASTTSANLTIERDKESIDELVYILLLHNNAPRGCLKETVQLRIPGKDQELQLSCYLRARESVFKCASLTNGCLRTGQ